MSLRHTITRLDQIPYESATRRSIQLPRNRYIKAIDLWLTGSVTVGVGGAGTVLEDAVQRLINRIQVNADGIKTIFNLNAQQLYNKNQREYGVGGSYLQPTAAVAATYPIELFLRIPFENNVGVMRPDTYLPANLFKSLDLIIDWAPLTAMFDTDQAGACTTTDITIRPVVYETTEPNPSLVRIQDSIETQIAATTTEFPVDLPLGNRVYQDFMFLTFVDVAKCGRTRSNLPINFINLVTDNNFRHIQTLPFIHHQASNKTVLGLEGFVPEYAAGAEDTHVRKAGVLYLYMLEDGLVPSGLNVLDVNTARFILDVTLTGATSNRIHIVHDSVSPIDAFMK
jgi:hypothetical protein